MSVTRIITGFNSAFVEHVCCMSDSVADLAMDVSEISFGSHAMSEAPEIIPSWEKIGIIRDNLSDEYPVLWMDADSMMVSDPQPVTDMLSQLSHGDILVAKDENGINCGVMGFYGKACARILDDIESRYEKFKDHPWFEQAAFHEIIDSYVKETGAPPSWLKIAPKHIFNAYTNELCPDTCILHFAGFSPEDKLTLMQAQLIADRRNKR